MYMLIYQVGSAQDFVESSKKLRDYWSGSYLVSMFNLCAMSEFNKNYPNSIIYPAVDNFDCTNNQNSLYGSVTNRFFAHFDTTDDFNTIDDKVRRCNTKLNQMFADILDYAKSKIEKELRLNSNSVWDDIWNRQKQWKPEIYYKIVKYDNGKFYKDNLKNAEIEFLNVKHKRQFEQIMPEKGYKCTICGIREALLNDNSKKYSNYKKFWNEISNSLKTYFKSNEMLCGVCSSKRFFPDFLKDKGFLNFKPNFPSTSTIAVYPVLDYMSKNHDDEMEELFKIISNAGIIFERSYKYYDNQCKKEDRLYCYDGDILISSNYEKSSIKNYTDKNIDSSTLKIIVKKLNNILEKIEEKKGFRALKYLAAVKYDVDNLGTKINSCESVEQHKKISSEINIFNSIVLPKICEQLKFAEIIYSGGDEGLIFVHLDYLIDLIFYINGGFHSYLLYQNDKFELNINNDKPMSIRIKDKNYEGVKGVTISISAAIFHHQESLFDVIEKVNAGMEKVKTQKNGFCISLLKRGGEDFISSIFSWNKRKEIHTFLTEMISLFKTGSLSKNVLNELKDLNRAEIENKDLILYYISRHMSDSSIKIDEIKEYIKGFKVSEIVSVLMLSSYIARGGGK